MESTTSLNYSAKEFFYDNSFNDYETIKPKFFDLSDLKFGTIRFVPPFDFEEYQSVGRHYRKELADQITAQAQAYLHDVQEMLFERKMQKIVINSIYGISHRYEVKIIEENTDDINNDRNS